MTKRTRQFVRQTETKCDKLKYTHTGKSKEKEFKAEKG